jgi:uncharacterized YccA/Bax inhibitor family protein
MAQATTRTISGAVTTPNAIRRPATAPRPVVVLWFAVASGVVIGLAGVLLALAYGGDAGRRAIVASAVLAWLAQVLAFTIVWRLGNGNVMAAWTLGMVLRLVVLLLYGLVGVRALSVHPEAALVSLAVFFFLSTLIEPWFLRS